MARQQLSLWWGEIRVAELEARRANDIRARFTAEARQRWAAGTPAISCSMPVQRQPVDANPFLRGLLPEGQHLQAMAAAAGVATSDTYRLVRRYGRDVAGALVITAAETPADETRWAVEEYTDDALAVAVAELRGGTMGLQPDSELSIAGLQNKMLLVRLDSSRWGRPIGGRPSTHILKLDDQLRPGLVELEAECLGIARSVGATTTEAEVLDFDGTKALIVERFDRSGIQRLHVEDACQALGTNLDADRGRGKYESSGGPTLRQIARLLVAHSRDPVVELEALLRRICVTVAIGDADAHGKNISLFHHLDGTIALAPMYDTVPTALWPTLRATHAMSIGASFDPTASSLIREATAWGIAKDRAHQVISSALGAVDRAAIDATEPLGELIRSNVQRELRKLDSPTPTT